MSNAPSVSLSQNGAFCTTAIQLQPETVYDVIKANVMLHIFVMTKEPMQIEDPEMPITLPSISMPDARSTRAVLQMRDFQLYVMFTALQLVFVMH